MAIAFVQQNTNANGSATTTITAAYSSAQTAGNTNFVLAASFTSATISSCNDSIGNGAYTQDQTIVNGTNIVLFLLRKSSILAAGAGANTVTVTFSTSVTGCAVLVLEYSGVSANLDGTPTTSSGTGTALAAASLSTTNANDLVLGCGGTNGAASTLTAGSPFTSRSVSQGSSSTPNMMVEDDIVSSTGSFTGPITASVSGQWGSIVAAYKATVAAAGGGFVPVYPVLYPGY